MTPPMTEEHEVAAIAERLSERPTMALLALRPGQELRWDAIAGLARKPGDRRAMAYRTVVRPLENRGLIEVAFEGSYDPLAGEYEWKRYRLSPTGVAVRTHFQSKARAS